MPPVFTGACCGYRLSVVWKLTDRGSAMPDRVQSPAVTNPEATDIRCTDKPSLSFDQQWRQENQQAISGYNGLVEQQGVFSEGVRRF